MDRSDRAAFEGEGGGEGGGATAVELGGVDPPQMGRSSLETLEYVGELVDELWVLVERMGSERLATLLLLAQFEVRWQLSTPRDLKRP